mmetsp:Transcript_13698/g.29404  ORF Transcript_13698/g.29404 Transcript_13698/m.29404 type:complete len:238 (+) Transcript_13698:228-941(+)
MCDYSVLVPTYNESENIAVFAWILNEHTKNLPYSFELVVVDDNSPDGTQDIVRQLQAKWNGMPIMLITRPRKLGLGSAYMDGIRHARGQYIFLMDADLSHHPKYIPDFIAQQRATGCDIVTGTRYASGGGVAGWNMARKLTSRGANLLASVALGATASDLTGAFRLYRRTALESVLPQVTSQGYAFQMEVIVRAQYRGCSIREVPIIFVDRLFGQSKLGPAEFLLFLKGLLNLLLTV